MDHLGSGREWDLVRKNGGLNIFPPFMESDSRAYTGRAGALANSLDFLRSQKEKYVVMTDSNIAVNFDFSKMIDAHIASGADITTAVKKVNLTKEQAKINILIDSNDDGSVTDVQAYPTNFEGEADINLNIMVMSRKYLQEIVVDSIAHNYNKFVKDLALLYKGRLDHPQYIVKYSKDMSDWFTI